MTRMWNPKRQKTLLKHWAAQHHLVLANKFFNKQERCKVRARPRAHERSPVQTLLIWRNNGTDRREHTGQMQRWIDLAPFPLNISTCVCLTISPLLFLQPSHLIWLRTPWFHLLIPCFNHLLDHNAAHATQILLDDLHERRPAIPRP